MATARAIVVDNGARSVAENIVITTRAKPIAGFLLRGKKDANKATLITSKSVLDKPVSKACDESCVTCDEVCKNLGFLRDQFS
jgi:hypothetical protein